MVYLLWLTIVLGGAFMAVGGARVLYLQGFELSLFLCVLLYAGYALYGLPKLAKLLWRRA
jgi:hypothetical protein